MTNRWGLDFDLSNRSAYRRRATAQGIAAAAIGLGVVVPVLLFVAHSKPAAIGFGVFCLIGLTALIVVRSRIPGDGSAKHGGSE